MARGIMKINLKLSATKIGGSALGGKTKNLKKGQSITEYTVFITVMVMALLAMQVYLKRGIQGKIKDMADTISPSLYNPNTTTSNYTTSRSRRSTSAYYRGVSNTTVLLDSTNRTGYDYVEPDVLY